MAESPPIAAETILNAAASISVPVHVGQYEEGQADVGLWCRPTGGFAPIPELGGGVSVRPATVQIVARGLKRDEGGAYDLARLAMFAIDHAAHPDWAPIQVQEGDPLPNGRDDQERFLFSINVIFVCLI